MDTAMNDITLRDARPEDCHAIAQLFLISSDGLAEYVWSRMDAPGLSPAEIGARRYAREGVPFSYQNCIMAERGGTVVGMAHSYPMEASDDADPESDPVLQPYAELEDAGSLYLSALALLPDHRNRGIGTRLLESVHAQARARGLPRVSLICMEPNEGAMRLYRRHRYVETARRAIVPHPTLHYAEGDALLLVKTF